MATIVATDGENLFWIDEVTGLQSTPVDTAPVQKQVDTMQGQVDSLMAGYPPISNLDAGTF